MQDFKKLDVWHKAIAVASRAHALARRLPAEERFELGSQIRRSSISIPSNIAEGAGRGSRRDFARFLRIAYGSACELETQLILAESFGFISGDELDGTATAVIEARRMLHALALEVDPQARLRTAD